MREICRYFKNGECLNPNCRYLHPTEYPVYIYCFPGIEIHPDELRLAVMANSAMAFEADNAWINNYNLFSNEETDKMVDISLYPDYFCMPFDKERVMNEINKNKQQTPRVSDTSRYSNTYMERPDHRIRDYVPQNRNGYQTEYKNNYNRNFRQNEPYSGEKNYDSRRNNSSWGQPDGNQLGRPQLYGPPKGRPWAQPDSQPQGRNQMDSQPQSRPWKQPDGPPQGRPWSGGGRYNNKPQNYGRQQGNYDRPPNYDRHLNNDRPPNYGRQQYGDTNLNKPKQQYYGNSYNKDRNLYNKQEDNNYRNTSQGYVQPSDYPGGFDRKPGPSNPENTQQNDNEEYDYHNVPYSYKQ